MQNFLIAGQKKLGYTNLYFLKILKELKITEVDTSTLLQEAISILDLRIQTRYFTPIKLIENHREYSGEGFAILTIQCTLIEFFECLNKGLIKKRGVYIDFNGHEVKNGPSSKRHIDTETMFNKFLKENTPFNTYFNTNAIRKSFYTDVRCKLMHQPQTMGGWKINANSKNSNILVLDGSCKILNRCALQLALINWFEAYKIRIKTDNELQRKFIFVMEDICNEGSVTLVETKKRTFTNLFFNLFNGCKTKKNQDENT